MSGGTDCLRGQGRNFNAPYLLNFKLLPSVSLKAVKVTTMTTFYIQLAEKIRDVKSFITPNSRKVCYNSDAKYKKMKSSDLK